MQLDVQTPALSSSGHVNTQKPKLQLQHQLCGETGILVFAVTKFMSIKILKTNTIYIYIYIYSI